jgi:hypothetical protein
MPSPATADHRVGGFLQLFQPLLAFIGKVLHYCAGVPFDFQSIALNDPNPMEK